MPLRKSTPSQAHTAFSNRFATARNVAGVCLVAAGLAACGSAVSTPNQNALTTPAAQKPIQLARKAAPAAPRQDVPSVVSSINTEQFNKAIQRYRINKRKKTADNKNVGVDLNGDGVPEVLALMQGEEWCTPAGCSLVLLRETARGYRPMQTVLRVKEPIVVSPVEFEGWRDVLVNTGGTTGTKGIKVRLRFSGKGYPKNAMRLPEVRVGIPSTGEVVIGKNRGPNQGNRRAKPVAGQFGSDQPAQFPRSASAQPVRTQGFAVTTNPSAGQRGGWE